MGDGLSPVTAEGLTVGVFADRRQQHILRWLNAAASDIGRLSPFQAQQREALKMDTTHDIDDIELTADEVRSLKHLEAFMHSRGYRRDRHGFWRLPGEEEYLAVPDSAEDDE